MTLESPAAQPPPSGYRIRPMELEDIPVVYAIDRLSFSLPWTERSYRFELTENAHSHLWVLEQPGGPGTAQVIGMIVIWLLVDEAHIGSIAVHPDHRRRGAARALLEFSLVEMARRGARTATLEVRRSNLAAQALYRQFGFSVVGLRPRYYRDNNEDALIMTLELPAISD